MKIIYQKTIKREDLYRNRGALYLFGDNLQGWGMGGQAAEMRGEINSLGIPTKRTPSMATQAFFTDEDFDQVKAIYDRIFKEEIRHKDSKCNREGFDVLVVPADGLGTGLAQLPQRAPKIYAYLLSKLNELEAGS